MFKKAEKFNFEIMLNGKYDAEGKAAVTKICFIPKSIRVETNEKETYQKEVEKILPEERTKINKMFYDAILVLPQEDIIATYIAENENKYVEIARSSVIADGKTDDEFKQAIKMKVDKIKESEKEKLAGKDVIKLVAEIADRRTDLYTMTKAITKTLLYVFSECIRYQDDTSKKVFKNADDVEDSITENDMTMLIDKWREFREGMEEADAKNS